MRLFTLEPAICRSPKDTISILPRQRLYPLTHLIAVLCAGASFFEAYA